MTSNEFKNKAANELIAHTAAGVGPAKTSAITQEFLRRLEISIKNLEKSIEKLNISIKGNEEAVKIFSKTNSKQTGALIDASNKIEWITNGLFLLTGLLALIAVYSLYFQVKPHIPINRDLLVFVDGIFAVIMIIGIVIVYLKGKKSLKNLRKSSKK